MRNSDDFDVFYAGTVRRITGYLYAVTGSQAEAEDAAQEAYARAWQRWGKVSGYSDPEGQHGRVGSGDDDAGGAAIAERERRARVAGRHLAGT